MTNRERLSKWVEDWRSGNWDGDKTPSDFLKEFTNSTESEVGADGDLWVDNPQEGHWLDGPSMLDFVNWLDDRYSIVLRK